MKFQKKKGGREMEDWAAVPSLSDGRVHHGASGSVKKKKRESKGIKMRC